jgi:hypothetical protein
MLPEGHRLHVVLEVICRLHYHAGGSSYCSKTRADRPVSRDEAHLRRVRVYGRYDRWGFARSDPS